MSYARITLIGNVGKDPVTKEFGGDRKVCEFTLAVNGSRNERGTQVEFTNWYNISMWGRVGEVAQQYVKKGSQVFLEGRLQMREYTKSDGATGFSLDVNASDMQLMGSRGEGQEGQPAGNGGGYNQAQQNGGSQQAYKPAPAQQAAPAAPAPITPDGGAADDDLPF